MNTKNLLCRLLGHKEVTAAVHKEHSMIKHTTIQTRCTRCNEVLESVVLSKKQSKRGR